MKHTMSALLILGASLTPVMAQDPPATETTAAETPATEAPAAETPAAETPAAETPAAETPAAETPAAETPAAETPAAETPAAEAAVAAAPAVADPFSPDVRAAIGPANAATGKVVFFRPSRFAGAAIGFKVREGETELGKLRNGRFFSIDVEPGTHLYTVHSEAKDVTTLEIEAGETYFVEGRMNMGFMVGRPNLTPSGVEAFEDALDKLKPTEPLSGDNDDNDAE